MSETRPHPKALEEIERDRVPGLVQVLQNESMDRVRHALRDTTGWHRDYGPPAGRSRAADEPKGVGWEMRVRVAKVVATVLHAAHERQVEKESEGFYRRSLG